MKQDLSPGPGWLICAGVVLGVLLGSSLLATLADGPAQWASPDQRNDWLGFWGGIAGGLCTIVAAIIAWLAVRPQLAEARKQSAAASRQTLVELADALAMEIGIAGRARSFGLLVNNVANDLHRAHNEDAVVEAENNAMARLADIYDTREKINSFQSRADPLSDEYMARAKVLCRLKIHSDNLMIIYTASLQKHADLMGNEVKDNAYAEARKSLTIAYVDIVDDVDLYLNLLDVRLRKVRSRIRELEEIALI